MAPINMLAVEINVGGKTCKPDVEERLVHVIHWRNFQELFNHVKKYLPL